ncbi:inositol monophosphatase family protein [Marinomonas mediterranea]|jgi:Archaeal fructose-1,6-bisphosphatase and related enzymes of inositol monophosphatase family|uniref:Inositol monophosphatase n=1 Tax=Marinomonas mediterranea (strain ATCC 700492 / JCM 21426 / NBRC 103028 / MMB-1) TaxID=717774 RepID=F2K482_MARM1|nr:inositol monophosphatase family protein [Marinomonas mediterranea]ADZ92523.1 inositol monophosphatase [Marinomonas mediterranea MMB-1]WCN10469.1 inositol monophosphatase [Marinomonas mediterranea]WCN14517.1 inositol monophosphatase [Marinomonas mediterranea]WCN18568.1 inositol monophosphatase [Marinomonas mediterranea MMB-1]
MQPKINVALKAARAASDFIQHTQEKILFDKEQGQQAAEIYNSICMNAERTIVQILEKAYPADTITTRLQGTVQNGEEGEWIVDAIQGQHAFTRGLSGFATTISYVVAGKVEHAVIVNPKTRDEFYASKGRGAYLNNSRIRTSQERLVEQATIATQFPGTSATQPYISSQLAVLQEVAEKGGRAIMQDAPALTFANVAAGRVDAAWGLELQEWELQAGVFIAKESGCIASGFDGAPSVQSGHVLCANPRMIKSLLPLLNKHFN